jgi:hypothetical protein
MGVWFRHAERTPSRLSSFTKFLNARAWVIDLWVIANRCKQHFSSIDVHVQAVLV